MDGLVQTPGTGRRVQGMTPAGSVWWEVRPDRAPRPIFTVRWIDAQKAAGFPVAAACRAAGVTRSRYYAWAAGLPHANHDEEARLLAEIRAIHTDSHGTYGSPRVHAQLRRHGWRVNRKRVERLMRVHGIVGHRPPPPP
jgi:HTH-like domain